MKRPVMALAFLAVSPLSAQTQAPPCTYDRCALRVENANPVFPGHLVQGVEGRPVATLGFFAPRIPLLESSGDSVRIPYEAFRARQRASSVLGVLSLASFVAAPFVVKRSFSGPGSTVYYVIGAGAVFGISALVTGAGAGKKLEEAIARYNDQLPDRR